MSALARGTATTTAVEVCTDVGSRSRDGDKDGGGGVLAEHTMALACWINGNDAGKADDSV